MESKRSPQLCDNFKCTGCSACFNSCPTDAIQMRPHPEEGFYRPIIDVEKCIKCLKCERSCPVINPVPKNEESDLIYAAWHLDEEVRASSSSGGAFTALAQSVIEQDGIVIGAAYDYSLHLRHIIIENQNDLKMLRASKYFQSDVGDTFKHAVTNLKLGRKVLFCGTPCQVAGFKAFLGNAYYDNLILVDFICHGVPSPLFFHSYLKWVEKKYGKIKDFKFRNKNKGWYDALRIAIGKRDYVMKGKYDSYWTGFNDNITLQEACYDCRFLGKNRNSDITIGDFWGIGQNISFGHKDEIEKGVSLIMVNTPNGEILFESSCRYLKTFKRSLEEVLTGNHAMIRSSIRPVTRNIFYQDLKGTDYDTVRLKYLRPSLKSRFIKILREYMPKKFIESLRIIYQK